MSMSEQEVEKTLVIMTTEKAEKLKKLTNEKFLNRAIMKVIDWYLENYDKIKDLVEKSKS